MTIVLGTWAIYLAGLVSGIVLYEVVGRIYMAFMARRISKEIVNRILALGINKDVAPTTSTTEGWN